MSTLYDILAAPFRAIGSLFSKGGGGGKGKTPKPSEGEQFFASLLRGFGWFGNGPGGWSQDRVLQVSKFRHWVYVAVRAIMEEIGQMPVQAAWRRSPEEAEMDRRRGKAWNYIPRHARLRRKALARLQGNEELELVPHDHPLLRLMHKPNAYDTYESFVQKKVMYGELTGNIFVWEAARNSLWHPTEQWVLPSHWVYRARQTQEQIDRGELVSGWEIRPYGVRSSTGIILPAEEVIHIAYPHPATPLDGYSPLTAGAEWIDTADAIDTARFAAMKQGIWPGLILKLMPEVLDPDPETRDRLRERFRQHYQGEDKFGKPLVLSPGVDVAQATRPPAEMDFGEGSDQFRDWILTLFRVSKAVVGITAEVNRASMEAAIASFYRSCIRPKLHFLDGVETEKVARRYDPTLILFHEDPTPDDPEELRARVETLSRCGMVTPNEGRAWFGLEPYEHGGDDPLVPPTLVPLPLNTGQDSLGAGGAGGGGDLDSLIEQIQGLRKPKPQGGGGEVEAP